MGVIKSGKKAMGAGGGSSHEEWEGLVGRNQCQRKKPVKITTRGVIPSIKKK